MFTEICKRLVKGECSWLGMRHSTDTQRIGRSVHGPR